MPPMLTPEIMKKRLMAVNCTQEAVQTCSKWVLHHRDSIDKIANCWMEIYKTANDKLRTAMIYVLNDVVQKASGKRDINVTFTFHPHLINAITISSSEVKKSISRCVDVFQERNVYPPHIIEEIKQALITRIRTEKATPDEAQNTGDVDFPSLVRGIESFYKNELLTEKAREILSRSSFNFKESVQARVKDRSEGVKALADMDASRQKMVNFLESVQKHQKNGLRLMELIKQAQMAFNLQLRDVTVVNDAYEKFSEGIRETKQQLDAIDSSGILLNESPPRDAPSPTANDDPFMHGVDGEELAGGGDDMEMDDDDRPGTSSQQCFLKPTKEYVASIPIPSGDMDPRVQRMPSNPYSVPPPSYGHHPQANGRVPLVMDPRQARFFAQQPPPSAAAVPSFPPPMNMNVPPPGISPPPQQQPQPMSAPGATPERLDLVDTSQPPPHQFFNLPPPTISTQNQNGGGMVANTDLASPSAIMYNPANPPPLFPGQNMMHSPPPSLFSQKVSPPNFSIPPPGLVHPTPFFSPQQQHPPQHSHHYGERGNGGPGPIGSGRRRNTMAESDDYRSKRGRDGSGWSGGHGNGGGGGHGRGNWRDREGGGGGRGGGGGKQHGHGGGGGGWRRSFAGGEAGQYRH